MPVSRWSYRLAPVDGGTEVTEAWQDKRGHGAHILGRVFTGKVARERPQANREGMRTTLARLKRELEEPSSASAGGLSRCQPDRSPAVTDLRG